jgi:hypothetical protein
VLVQQVPEALDDLGREVAAQVALQPRVVDELRALERARQQPLAVGDQQRQLRPLHPAPGAPALGDLLGRRQVL